MSKTIKEKDVQAQREFYARRGDALVDDLADTLRKLAAVNDTIRRELPPALHSNYRRPRLVELLQHALENAGIDLAGRGSIKSRRLVGVGAFLGYVRTNTRGFCLDE